LTDKIVHLPDDIQACRKRNVLRRTIRKIPGDNIVPDMNAGHRITADIRYTAIGMESFRMFQQERLTKPIAKF
jgi:hypothetical protein